MQEGPRRWRLERLLVQNQCWIFVASWTGVIRYHGPRPEPVRSATFSACLSDMLQYGLAAPSGDMIAPKRCNLAWLSVRLLYWPELQTSARVAPLQVMAIRPFCDA